MTINRTKIFRLLTLAMILLPAYSTVLAGSTFDTLAKVRSAPQFFYLKTLDHKDSAQEFRALVEAGAYQEVSTVEVLSTTNTFDNRLNQIYQVTVELINYYTPYYVSAEDRRARTDRKLLMTTPYKVICDLDSSGRCTLNFGFGQSIGPFEIDATTPYYNNLKPILYSSGFLNAQNKNDYLCSLFTGGTETDARICDYTLSDNWHAFKNSFDESSYFSLTDKALTRLLTGSSEHVAMDPSSTETHKVIVQEVPATSGGSTINTYEIYRDASKVCFGDAITGKYYESSCAEERGPYSTAGCTASTTGNPNYVMLALAAMAMGFYLYRRQRKHNSEV